MQDIFSLRSSVLRFYQAPFCFLLCSLQCSSATEEDAPSSDEDITRSASAVDAGGREGGAAGGKEGEGGEGGGEGGEEGVVYGVTTVLNLTHHKVMYVEQWEFRGLPWNYSLISFQGVGAN